MAATRSPIAQTHTKPFLNALAQDLVLREESGQGRMPEIATAPMNIVA